VKPKNSTSSSAPGSTSLADHQERRWFYQGQPSEEKTAGGHLPIGWRLGGILECRGALDRSKEGPVVQLVQVDDMERCQFEATFRVPMLNPIAIGSRSSCGKRIPPRDTGSFFLTTSRHRQLTNQSVSAPGR
jgi:hypothetical protein